MFQPIFSIGKWVVLDSGFCVPKGITDLLKFDIYTDEIIKKRRYWPKGVPGYAIYQYFADKDVTYVDMLETITEDGTKGKAFKILIQRTRVCHKYYGHLDDTQRVGWSGQQA